MKIKPFPPEKAKLKGREILALFSHIIFVYKLPIIYSLILHQLLKHSRIALLDTLGSRWCPSTYVSHSFGSVHSPCYARIVGHRFVKNGYQPFYDLLSLFLRIRYDKNGYQPFLSAHWILHSYKLWLSHEKICWLFCYLCVIIFS